MENGRKPSIETRVNHQGGVVFEARPTTRQPERDRITEQIPLAVTTYWVRQWVLSDRPGAKLLR